MTLTEALTRGWVCPDGSEHEWEDLTFGPYTVDRTCIRCGQLQSEVR